MTGFSTSASFDWRRLLDGPRGRQLCFACAADIAGRDRAPEQPSALDLVEFRLNVGRPGYGFYSPDGRVPKRATAQELLDVLGAVPPEPVASDRLPDLLGEVVASAMYWQEPDRRDTLLGRPEFRAALEPWADLLATHEATQWWPTPLDRADQWRVTWGASDAAGTPATESSEQQDAAANPAPPRRPGTEQARAALNRWRDSQLADERRFAAEQTAAPGNVSGRWWSTPEGLPVTTRRWPTERTGWDPQQPPGSNEYQVRDPLGALLVEDSGYPPRDADWSPVPVPERARVLELDGPDAWVRLCRDFPLDVSASRRADWYRTTGRDGAWCLPDWTQVAEHWDGAHLSVAHYLELAGRPLPVDDRRSTLIAGWSPDETLWLTGLPD